MVKLSRDTRPGGPRRTTVSRHPYWRPDTKQWTFLPVGPTHKSKVIYQAAGGEFEWEEDQYESKGWEPLRKVPDEDPRRDLLPTNYQEMMRDHKAMPVMPSATVVKEAFEKLELEPPEVDEPAEEAKA